MRHAAIIAGVILIAAVFAAVWFVLEPADSHGPNAPDLTAGSGSPEFAPLEGGPTAQPGREADPLNAGPDATKAPEDKPETAPESRPDPARVEVQPGTRPERLPGPETPPGETTGPAATGEEPGPQLPADVTSALPTFIKGHARPAGQNLGSSRPGPRRIAKPAGVKQLSEVTPKLMQDRRGLYSQYYRMDSADLTKLDTSSPSMVRIDRQVYFPDAESFSDLPISLENFAASWDGFLVIPEAGDYWLFWGADNGGRVELDGETVLLQDGMVRYVEVSTLLTLEAGLHPLRIEFAQQHNQVADWAKCAANFMYVPEGQTKPVAVPPEMLMVPEWMWSDVAPIITSLSKNEGEIGDEITIHGQGFQTSGMRGEISWERALHVTFAGQRAAVLEQTTIQLKVGVPIGAKTGNVIVLVGPYVFTKATGATLTIQPTIPSNSVTFTVTTHFGLMAEWHNLDGWSNFGLDVITGRTPDATRVHQLLYFAGPSWPNSQQPDLPFQQETLGAVFSFKLGVPAHTGKEQHEYTLASTTPVALSVNGKAVEAVWDAGAGLWLATFVLPCASESYAHVRVEWVSYSVEARMLVLTAELRSPSEDDDIAAYDALLPQYFFPPVVPPKPPVISDVKAVWAEGEQPVVPPYDVDASRPSVRVGQEFTFTIIDFGPPEIWDTQPTLTIDGVPLPYVSDDDPILKPENRVLFCRAIMPAGVGEGRMVARLSVVFSEPFYIDVANRGLVAYLYDVPEGSGLGKLPDLGPLTCFKVRKDRAINFEDTADFDLPFPAETFIIEWLGGLIIEEEGDYEFTCRSDDGMKLWLDDNVVLDADKLQAPAENKATVHLVPGVYRFRMQFFENTQHEVCVLEWRATRGEGAALEEIIPRQVIPQKAFSLDVHPPLPNKTSTGKRTDGS
jgi:hypothetical protein